MGIISRFKDIMSANINALLDKMEDPEKMVDQYLRNLESDLGKVKQETASVMADEQRAKRELDACNAQIDELQKYAEKAVVAGNDEDARKFLEQKQTLVTKQQALQQTYTLATRCVRCMISLLMISALLMPEEIQSRLRLKLPRHSRQSIRLEQVLPEQTRIFQLLIRLKLRQIRC